jgi:mRNA-degrading endonuclease RelE of RelBE toxin-antitoxin system
MEFIEAPAFTRYVAHYLDEDGYRQLQYQLSKNPELGDVIPGTGGFRKLRWGDPNRGKGRRGGLRIIYYYFLADRQVWLMTLYNKDEASDLSPRVKKTLKSALETELHARKAARIAQGKKSRRSR